jgi:hypothetical protein
MNSKFWKSKFCSLYMCKGIGYLWFQLFNFKFKVQKTNKVDLKQSKGYKMGQWIITIVK